MKRIVQAADSVSVCNFMDFFFFSTHDLVVFVKNVLKILLSSKPVTLVRLDLFVERHRCTCRFGNRGKQKFHHQSKL